MDDATIAATLASVAPVTTGDTVGKVLDTVLAAMPMSDLRQLMDARKQANTKAATLASVPAIPDPANAAAIYTWILNANSEPDYATALLDLKHAAQEAQNTPPTKTFNEVWERVMYLVSSVFSATPHVAAL